MIITTSRTEHVKEELHDEGGVVVHHRVQNVAPIIEDVKERSENWKGRDMHYLGSMPLVVHYKLVREANGSEDKLRALAAEWFRKNPAFTSKYHRV